MSVLSGDGKDPLKLLLNGAPRDTFRDELLARATRHSRGSLFNAHF